LRCFLVVQSRAALSLLGYCYFYMQDFVNAANCYEQLSILYPDMEEYVILYGQSLYQACLYEEAYKVTCTVENPEYQGKVVANARDPFKHSFVQRSELIFATN
jgi:tetratricopeptide repeat protein 30